jgi:hypothetical protein
MAFIQPCFIRKNTAELRRKLESLGYRKGGYPLPVGREDVYDRDIHLYENSYHFRDSTLYGITNNIDCGTNEDLFLALAALRNDTDKEQWFIYNTIGNQVGKFETVEWVKCLYVKMEDYFSYDSIYKFMRKATVEELIEHFKKK